MISLDTVCRGKLSLGFLLLLRSSCLPVWSAPIISLNVFDTLLPGQTLVSTPLGHFELGIFPYPALNSKNYYLCIRYALSIDPQQVVTWMANRDIPLSNNSMLQLSKEGSLQLKDLISNTNPEPWSTTANPTVETARLLETGNLVLVGNGETKWDSFVDSPSTDTLLPGQKLHKNQKLISWRNKADPSTTGYGTYSFGWDNKNILTLSWTSPKANLSTTWRGGAYIPAPDVYDKHTISNVEYVYFHLTLGHLYINSKPADTAILSGGADKINATIKKRITIDTDGGFRIWQLTVGAQNWTSKANWVVSDRPDSRSQCTTYGTCGPYGLCTSPVDSLDRVQCECPRGFTFIDSTDTAQGCTLVKNSASSTCGNANDVVGNPNDFVELDGVDMPWGGDYNILYDVGNDPSRCWSACQNDCLCAGAVYSKDEQKCWLKTETLYNLGYPTVPLHGNDRFAFIKLIIISRNSNVEESNPAKWKKPVEIVVPVVVGIFVILAAILCACCSERVTVCGLGCGLCSCLKPELVIIGPFPGPDPGPRR